MKKNDENENENEKIKFFIFFKPKNYSSKFIFNYSMPYFVIFHIFLFIFIEVI